MARVLWCAVMLMVPMVAFAQPKVATPTFSVAGGEHASLVMVVVRVKTPGATIRLTQNGADPTDADPVVASEATIVVRASTVLKARAFLAGRRPSDVRTAAFTILEAPPLGPGDAAAAGARSILAIPSGRVIEWRRNEAPRLVDGLSGITAVAAGAGYALALTNEGSLYGWGVNAAGQLGDGSEVRRPQPVRIPGLSNVVRIAAGRSHGLALTADGRVWAWGANGNGQLGVGTPGNRRVPTLIPSLADIVGIDAGNAHSIAITRTGDVFAWGANTHGQLGDATRKKRTQPVRIALSDVIQVAAGATHTLALQRNGTVYAWGSGARGELGTGAQADSTRPAAIGNVLAVAIRAGRRFSAAVRPDGTLMTWGANEAGQLGDGSRLDRPVPTPGPSLTSISALSLGGRHALAVTANGDVWTWGRNDAPSESIDEVAVWGPPIATPPVATVAASPAISPAGGVYAAQQTIAITTSDPDIALRYTLDGSDPTELSPAYSSPFIVSANIIVKARAFAKTAGIAPSLIVTASYIIDTAPPSITAHISPTLTGAWYTTPVTVTFECADDSGSVSCPQPIVVVQDGASQVISGTATDAAGRQATAAVTVSIDRTPPSVVLTESPDGGTTTAAQVLLTGQVIDTLSGLAGALRCNGAAVSLAQDSFECLVTLTPGRNSVTLQAQDSAGNVAAAGIVVTRAGNASRMAMTPDTRTMVLDDVAPLSLRDEFGVAVPDAEWTSSDPAVAMVVNRGSPFVVPMGFGTAVISATKGDLTAASTVTVDPAATLPTGTLRWSVSPTSGLTMEAPIFTHRVDPSVPHMFLVESGSSGPATLRAATAEGDVLWTMEAPGIPLMGDAFGSVLTGVPYNEFARFEFKALVRVGHAGGVPPWRYDSSGLMQKPSQAQDGTIYVIEFVPAETDQDGTQHLDKFAVTIDGRNGREVGRYRFPRDAETFKATVGSPTGDPCASSRIEQLADHIGPVAGSGSEGYVLIRRRERHVHASCTSGADWPTRTITNGVDLLVLSPGGAAVVQPVFEERCVIPTSTRAGCDLPASLTQIMPDGIGGVLARWEHGILSNGRLASQEVISRKTAAGGLDHRPMDERLVLHSVGQNGLLYAWTSESTMALDVTSWAPKWTAYDLLPVAAHPDGGIAADRGEITLVDDQGQITDVVPGTLGLISPIQEFNSWIGIRDAQLHVVAGEYPDATRFASQIGNSQRQGAVRTPGLGIFLKSHLAQEMPLDVSRYRHLSVRIVPHNQEKYRNQTPGFDQYGNWYHTIGAGPYASGGDTNNCINEATLLSGVNRAQDFHRPPWDPLEPLAYDPAREDAIIEQLFTRFRAYDNDLSYGCFPENNDGFYNSNSYAAGLLNAVGLAVVGLPTRVPALFPGVRKPVPLAKFQ